jgi:PadR family transcriptional regulator PadR
MVEFRQLPRMTLQTQKVLAALLRHPTRPHYGLEIAKDAGLPSGTLYPLLARLETAGWVESRWEEIDPVAVGRRARRYYTLTGEGEVAARAEVGRMLAALRQADPTVSPRPPTPREAPA